MNENISRCFKYVAICIQYSVQYVCDTKLSPIPKKGTVFQCVMGTIKILPEAETLLTHDDFLRNLLQINLLVGVEGGHLHYDILSYD